MHLTYDIPTLAIRKNYQCVTKFDNVSEFVVIRYHAFTMTRKRIVFSYKKVYWEIGVNQAEQLNSVLVKSVPLFQQKRVCNHC